MPIKPAINPGTVDWSGENPGILLKTDADGPFTAMALFFRIAYSPAGRGCALLLFEDPQNAASLPSVRNVIISDNQPMAQYLKDNFIAKLAAFRDAAAFDSLQFVDAVSIETSGDHRSQYSETINTADFTVELIWEELGEPVALELPPELTGAKEREAYTLLVESKKASIRIDGVALPGKPAARVQAGIETTTAFLYFAETWIDPMELLSEVLD
jgi:hypothetical protein